MRELYARIAADPRHSDPRIMLDREIPCRVFADWSMGYECPDLNDPETRRHVRRGALGGA